MNEEHNKTPESFDALKTVSLTQPERVSMRNTLLAYMAEHPLRAPLRIRTVETITAIFVRLESRSVLRPVGLAFALVMVVGIGTTYAAEGALPGDTLYPIKIHVAEKIETALAPSAVAKAQLTTVHITRRLEEAETLASSGKLTPVARAQIEEQVNQSATDFDTTVQAVQASSGGDIAVAAVQSELEASLLGHQHVLATLSVELPAAAPALSPILASVHSHAERMQKARVRSEGEVVAKQDGSVRTAAVATQGLAKSKLNEVKAKAVVAARVSSAAATQDASTSAVVVEDAIKDGSKKLKEGKYGEAFGTFQAAIRAAEAVNVNLDAQEQLNTNASSTPAEDNHVIDLTH